MWRIDPDGTVEQTELELPTYNSGFSTFFAGKVVFAGTRCDGQVEGENCDGESVVELRLVDEGDQDVETVELFREPGSRYRSVGVQTLGAADDQLWLQRDIGDLSVVSPDGEVSDLDVDTGPESPADCLVGGDLYGLSRTTSGSSEEPDAGSSPEPTSYDAGSQAPAGAETWTVSQWDGSAWTAVEDGVFTRDGEEASMTCVASGFAVHSYAMDATYAVWTPEGGWRAPTPTLASVNRGDLLVSSTYTDYLVQDTGVQRVDLDGVTPTPLTTARLGENLTGALIDVVDDAGALLVACGLQDDGQTQCIVTPDD